MSDRLRVSGMYIYLLRVHVETTCLCLPYMAVMPADNSWIFYLPPLACARRGSQAGSRRQDSQLVSIAQAQTIVVVEGPHLS